MRKFLEDPSFENSFSRSPEPLVSWPIVSVVNEGPPDVDDEEVGSPEPAAAPGSVFASGPGVHR